MNQGLTSTFQRIRTDAEREALEGRVALRIAGALDASANALGHDVRERLRFAREQAVGKARRLQVNPAPVTVSAGGAMALGGPELPWGWRVVMSAMPAVALLLGLIAVDAWKTDEQISAAADMDAVILADDLPPEAYSDPGFAEFVREPVVAAPGTALQ